MCPSAARGSTLSSPRPCEHLSGNKRQFAVVFSPLISVFNKFQLCIFFIYQANFLMKRTLLLLVSSLVSSSLAVPLFPLPLGPELAPGPRSPEHFACLNHCLSRTSLTRSPKLHWCSGVSQRFPPFLILALLKGLLGSKTDRNDTACCSQKSPSPTPLRLIGDVPDSRGSVSERLNLEHSSVQSFSLLAPRYARPAPFHVLNDGQDVAVSCISVFLPVSFTVTGPLEGVL